MGYQSKTAAKGTVALTKATIALTPKHTNIHYNYFLLQHNINFIN